MIALVSFPRSGNTFFRNLLFELYGLESSTFHREEGRSLDENWASFPVIKTHLMPEDLPPEMEDLKIVYIVRDGRDALVSLAHHRKDIVEPGTDYYNNLLEATLAAGGSYFGGWSKNVAAWTERADLVIRYEDLIVDPVRETERLREIIDLPAPKVENLPTFKDLKFGQPQYGAGSGKQFDPSMLKKNFRKGKSGSWMDEMPEDLHQLFWQIHGEQMVQQGYTNGQLALAEEVTPYNVLIEVSKIFTKDNDGIKRYVDDLLMHLSILTNYLPQWKIDLLFQGQIQPMRVENGSVQFDFVVEENYEQGLLRVKSWVKRLLPAMIYEPLSRLYRQGPFRRFLAWLRETVVRSKQVQDDGFKRQLEQYDLIHIPLPQHVPLVSFADVPQIITVHDLTHKFFPEFHTPENIRLSEKGFEESLRKDNYFIAISEATAKDLSTNYSLEQERIRVIYEGVSGRFNTSNKSFDFARIREKYDLPAKGDFLLSLSTIEPRKNIQRVIAAFQQFRTDNPTSEVCLFICGKKGWLADDIFSNEERLQESGIYFTGFIAEEDLPLFYRHALALCYVSLYEGFGLPILEAMQSGVPVIYGDNSSMPEVAGAGGLGVDANSVELIARAMEKLATDNKLRAQLAEQAWRHANTFSLTKSAYHTLMYYEEIIAKGR